MLPEVLSVLSPRAGETYVDCTAGLGGHAAAMATHVAGGEPAGRVVLCDLDQGNLERASGAVSRAANGMVQIVTMQGNFAQVPYEMESRGIVVDMLLADFGFASPQVDDAQRGFSFQREGPLDMRMDVGAPATAADLVASLSERELAQIIDEYGEERNARRIAKKLVQEQHSHIYKPSRVRSFLPQARICVICAGVAPGGVDISSPQKTAR